MDMMREWLRTAWNVAASGGRRLWEMGAARGLTRMRLAIGGGVGLLLVLVVALIVALLGPGTNTQTRVAQVVVPTVLPTATATVTPTVTPKPTAAPVKHDPPKPVPKTPPPPPLPPPPPPPPTPTTAPGGTSGGANTGPITVPFNDSAFSYFCPVGASSGTPTPTNCVPCPYYAGTNPTQSEINAALTTAAQKYGLPVNMVKAVAWQESKWHEDVLSCDGGVGLMQIQYYYANYFNGMSDSVCGIAKTSDDPYTLAGNADLGAKYLKYLTCFYNYSGGVSGATPSSPAQYTAGWYYQQAKIPFPDSFNADGSVNPNSMCMANYNNANYPYFQALPMTNKDTWSCPFNATANDNSVLTLVLSAYNAGPGAIGSCGCIPNASYELSVKQWITEFASGALPQPS